MREEYIKLGTKRFSFVRLRKGRLIITTKMLVGDEVLELSPDSFCLA